MRTVSFLGACLVLGMSPAWAVDPLGFYVGAGAGESTVQSTSLLPVEVSEHPTGWKVFAGWRPIEMFGAEVEYVDLGSRNSTYISSAAATINSQHASASAVGAFLVGYLPQPLPYLDFYGKLGVADLHNNISNSTTAYPVSCGVPCTTQLGQNASNVRFAYAAGMQLKFGAPAVRLEYQGFTTSGGDQSLLSLELAWNF
jgi:Outer membrane protein beta-barrel domain